MQLPQQLGQLGFRMGTGGRGGGAFGTQAKGGGPVQRFERQGKIPPSCPSGARSVSSGSYGTGTSTRSWRDCEMRAARPAPVAPPPPAPEIAVTTQVSPAIQTQVSPQISPVMTQLQDSPGAGVIAAPQQVAPAPMTARPQQTAGPGFDPEAYRRMIREQEEARAESQRIQAEWARMDEEKARREAAHKAEEQRRIQAEREAAERYQRGEQQRQAFLRELQTAEEEAARQAAERRAAAVAEDERRAAEAADATRMTPGMVGAPVPLGPVISAPLPAAPAPAAPVDVSTDVQEAGFPVPILLLAAAVGVGALMLTQGKKRRKK